MSCKRSMHMLTWGLQDSVSHAYSCEGKDACTFSIDLLWVLLCRRIAAAIAEAGLTGQVHPTDYLMFFCLGKRENPPSDQVGLDNQLQPHHHYFSSLRAISNHVGKVPKAMLLNIVLTHMLLKWICTGTACFVDPGGAQPSGPNCWSGCCVDGTCQWQCCQWC